MAPKVLRQMSARELLGFVLWLGLHRGVDTEAELELYSKMLDSYDTEEDGTPLAVCQERWRTKQELAATLGKPISDEEARRVTGGM